MTRMTDSIAYIDHSHDPARIRKLTREKCNAMGSHHRRNI